MSARKIEIEFSDDKMTPSADSMFLGKAAGRLGLPQLLLFARDTSASFNSLGPLPLNRKLRNS